MNEFWSHFWDGMMAFGALPVFYAWALLGDWLAAPQPRTDNLGD